MEFLSATTMKIWSIQSWSIQRKDSSGMATFILFNSEAEKLLNISAKDLLNKCLEVRICKIKFVFNIY